MSKNNVPYKPITALIVILSLFTGAYSLQRQIDTKEQRVFSDHILLAFPTGDYLKSAAFGFDALFADLLWAHTVVEVGEQLMTNQDYADLARRLEIITTLDPLFNEAYRFGGILLAMQAGQVDESILLLEKGLKHFPDDWNLYFTLGFNYTYYKNDSPTAITHFERAAALPGSPKYLPRLIGNLYADTGKIDMALVFLKEAHKQFKDPKMRAEIEEKIKELLIEKHKILLEAAAEKYGQIRESHPDTREDLAQTVLIPLLPNAPHGSP